MRGRPPGGWGPRLCWLPLQGASWGEGRQAEGCVCVASGGAGEKSSWESARGKGASGEQVTLRRRGA